MGEKSKAENLVKPKVFLSYSWTNQAHQELVIKCAERLAADGVDIVLDVYDLKEGHDKYAFMEKMVTDKSMTHVLIFSDKKYAEKSDSRQAGVGTESQIISKEVYEKTDQSKFIPLVCEFSENHEPYLPIFLRSRIWVDFSTPEAINKNWERLIRVLFGKPLYAKPKAGSPPAYINTEEIQPVSPARAKFESFRQALFEEKPSAPLLRRQFFDECIKYADELRVRSSPEVKDAKELADKIITDFKKLIPIRDQIIDWVLLESAVRPSGDFITSLIEFLEKIRETRARPKEVTSWNEAWFDAHKLFTYEVFLYTIAALLKNRAYADLHEIFTNHYIRLDGDTYGDAHFVRFDGFYAYSDILNASLTTEGRKYYSAAAELLKRNAQRNDLPFDEIIQADLLALLMAFVLPDVRWYPQTLHYAQHGRVYPLFLRATQHKHFANLATITGVSSADELRNLVAKGRERLGVERWNNFMMFGNPVTQAMSLENLDTLK